MFSYFAIKGVSTLFRLYLSFSSRIIPIQFIVPQNFYSECQSAVCAHPSKLSLKKELSAKKLPVLTINASLPVRSLHSSLKFFNHKAHWNGIFFRSKIDSYLQWSGEQSDSKVSFNKINKDISTVECCDPGYYSKDLKEMAVKESLSWIRSGCGC